MPYNPLLHKTIFGAVEKAKAPDRFSAWGKYSKDAQEEGWMPVSWNGQTTEYRNKYNNQFNQVVDPNMPSRAYIAAIGGNNNSVFDLVIKDSNGKVLKQLQTGVSPEQVRGYFTNPQSTIAQRVNSIVAGKNKDRYMSDGSYTPLK